MGIREDLNNHDNRELLDYEAALRDKLWKEDKIRIQGYTYSEFKKLQEERRK